MTHDKRDMYILLIYLEHILSARDRLFPDIVRQPYLEHILSLRGRPFSDIVRQLYPGHIVNHIMMGREGVLWI